MNNFEIKISGSIHATEEGGGAMGHLRIDSSLSPILEGFIIRAVAAQMKPLEGEDHSEMNVTAVPMTKEEAAKHIADEMIEQATESAKKE